MKFTPSSFFLMATLIFCEYAIFISRVSGAATSTPSPTNNDTEIRPYAVLGPGRRRPKSHADNPDIEEEYTDTDTDTNTDEVRTEPSNTCTDETDSRSTTSTTNATTSTTKDPQKSSSSTAATEAIARESLRKSLLYLQKLLLSMAGITFLFIVLYSSYYIYMLKSAYAKDMVAE